MKQLSFSFSPGQDEEMELWGRQICNFPYIESNDRGVILYSKLSWIRVNVVSCCAFFFLCLDSTISTLGKLFLNVQDCV